jgi:hypothetical protein
VPDEDPDRRAADRKDAVEARPVSCERRPREDGADEDRDRERQRPGNGCPGPAAGRLGRRFHIRPRYQGESAFERRTEEGK